MQSHIHFFFYRLERISSTQNQTVVTYGMSICYLTILLSLSIICRSVVIFCTNLPMRNIVCQLESSCPQLVDIGTCTIYCRADHIISSTQVLDVTYKDTRLPLLTINNVDPLLLLRNGVYSLLPVMASSALMP